VSSSEKKESVQFCLISNGLCRIKAGVTESRHRGYISGIKPSVDFFVVVSSFPTVD